MTILLEDIVQNIIQIKDIIIVEGPKNMDGYCNPTCKDGKSCKYEKIISSLSKSKCDLYNLDFFKRNGNVGRQ